MQIHLFDAGDPDCKMVLDQLYRAYAERHENDPPNIQNGFAELESYLETLALNDNNAVFNFFCRICVALEYKAFLHGLQYSAALIMELGKGAYTYICPAPNRRRYHSKSMDKSLNDNISRA